MGDIGSVTLPGGLRVPALGQGTWRMGEDPARRHDETAALRAGIERGMTLIDTAEMYAEGGAEQVVGEAIAGRRDEVFLVSKVRPENASEMKMMLACEKSLERLGVERLDLYLLHWEGNVPLDETVEAFRDLIDEGMIARWGVSNLDLRAMEQLMEIEGGEDCAANQLLYNLASRGVLERSGFKYEGVAQSYLQINGRWRNHVLYSNLRHDRRGKTEVR